MNRRVFAVTIAAALISVGCPADGPLPAPDSGADAGIDAAATDSGDEDAITLDSVEPTEGPVAGGTEVTLTGGGFVEGMTVRFGSASPVDATVASPTEATATTPSSPTAGSVTVVVRTPDGETDSLLNGFDYLGDGDSPSIGFCQLQAQSPVSATTGQPSEQIFAIVFADGLTQGEGQGSGIDGELGWGDGTNPEDFNFVAMTYNLDKDGLNAGDLANDEYGAALSIAEAGTYRYAARFRASPDADWTYCDLDGSENGVAEDQLGTLEVTDPPTPLVGFCQTNTTSVVAETGQQSETIRGTVFVAGATVGAGAGSDVEGEVVWGPAGTDPDTWTDSAAATYDSDADGLNSGDLANDVWTAAITTNDANTYNYLYRFSADGGTTWRLCDTDGTSGDDDFDPTAVGTLEVSDVLVSLADACNLQFPEVVSTGEVGVAIDVYGRVTEPPLTGSGQTDPDLVAELLVGPAGEDPTANFAAFETVTAGINANTIDLGPDEDEYVASWSPATAGEYSIGYRFSVDGGDNWSYCDLDADESSFAPDGLGWVAVTDGAPDVVDFCHVFQQALMDDPAGAGPTITVELFDDPTTIGNDGANSGDFTVESGWGRPRSNPALWPASRWTGLGYKGLRAGFPNNYEYEGDAYGAGNAPAAGNYQIFVRAKPSGAPHWTYCDTDEGNAEVLLDAATTLTVQ